MSLGARDIIMNQKVKNLTLQESLLSREVKIEKNAEITSKCTNKLQFIFPSKKYWLIQTIVPRFYAILIK